MRAWKREFDKDSRELGEVGSFSYELQDEFAYWILIGKELSKSELDGMDLDEFYKYLAVREWRATYEGSWQAKALNSAKR